MEGTILLIAIVAVVVGYYLLTARQRDQVAQTIGATARFPVGKHLSGFSCPPGTRVECAVTQDDFVFIGAWGAELGRIPRRLINEVLVDDRSVILQRLGVGRLLLLGPFALAFPKRTKGEEFAVGLRWEDDNGLVQHTVFGFSGDTGARAANEAANALKTHALPRARRLSTDETTKAGMHSDIYEQIRKLADLRASGAITAEEYDTKKAELLRRI